MTKQSTSKEYRYRRVLAVDSDARMRLQRALQWSTYRFNLEELEAGCALVSEHLYGDHRGIAYSRYGRRLLEETRHGYWPWFIARKMGFDREFDHGYLVDYPDEPEDYEVRLLRAEYVTELTAFLAREDVRQGFRHFMNRSTTLFSNPRPL